MGRSRPPRRLRRLVWTDQAIALPFLYEHGNGTELFARLTGKIHGYAGLAAETPLQLDDRIFFGGDPSDVTHVGTTSATAKWSRPLHRRQRLSLDYAQHP